MRLNHNMNSLSTYNVYKKNLKVNESVMEKISTGLKINAAKDNPNKIGQSEQMRIQIKSLNSAQRSTQDAVSMLQTADGALEEASAVLCRMKELAVSAADGTKTNLDRNVIQMEYDQLSQNLFQISKNTEFNGVKMLGEPLVSNNDFPIHRTTVTGAMVGEEAYIPMYNISPDVLKDSNGAKLSELKFDTASNSSKNIKSIDDYIEIVSSVRMKYGAMSNRFQTTTDNIDENNIILQKAESSIRDADIGVEVAELARTNILNDTSLALIAQTNQLPLDALKILERTRWYLVLFFDFKWTNIKLLWTMYKITPLGLENDILLHYNKEWNRK